VRYPDKFFIFQNPKNMKLAFSLNECLKRSSGELIARMDADDISHPKRFEKQVKYLEDNPDVKLVGTEAIRFDESSRNLIEMESVPNKYQLAKKVIFIHATIMTYRSVYSSVRGYTVKSRTIVGQDLDFYFKFFAAGFIGHNIKEALYEYRKIKNTLTSIGIVEHMKYNFRMLRTQWIGFKSLKFPKRLYFLAIGVQVYSLSKFIVRKTLGLL
jgi:glycosyltransferase EpsE